MGIDLQALIQKLAATSSPRVYTCGEIIQRQHEPINAISIVLSGKALARTVTYEGNEIWIDEFKEGDVFGFELLSAETSAKFDIISRSNISLLEISMSTLERIGSTNPHIIISLLAVLSQKLNFQTERLIEAHSLSSRGRICAELRRFCRPVGVNPGTYIIRPTPIFSEFALRVGSTRESVSRTVSNLVSEGIIVRKAGALLIPDLEKLSDQVR